MGKRKGIGDRDFRIEDKVNDSNTL